MLEFLKSIVLPTFLFFVGYRSARRKETKDEAVKRIEQVRGEERRVEEMSVQMQEVFSRRWDKMEKYWTERIEELRAELRDALKREDDCEIRERILQKRLNRIQRWAIDMVSAWNLQFPNNPMVLPDMVNDDEGKV